MTRQQSKLGRITTHVLDTGSGRPAAGMLVELHSGVVGQRVVVSTASTDADGRCTPALLEGEAMQAGQYEIVFHVGAWRSGHPGFYDTIPIRFTVEDPRADHHVPLIFSAFGYSTYRGS